MAEYVHQRCNLCGEDSLQAQFFIARNKETNDIVSGYICPKCHEKVKSLNLIKEERNEDCQSKS